MILLKTLCNARKTFGCSTQLSQIAAALINQLTLQKRLYTCRLAIIGAGIGGTTTAYYLREQFGEQAHIELFEHGEVGGRLATVKIGGHDYEAGGSVVHPGNEYMVNFTNMFGLERKEDSHRFGIFDGKEIIFQGSSYDLVMAFQMLYRYGLSVFSLNSYVQAFMADFKRIYKHQNEGYSFTTVKGLLDSMSPRMPPMLHRTIQEEMRTAGVGDQFIDELVMGAMTNNYGQDIHVGAFVGAVSMCGIEPGLWSVRGGNKLVPQHIVKHLQIKVNQARVKDVTLKTEQNNIKYEINTEGASEISDFDIVVIATPLHDKLSDIAFKNFPNPIGNFPQRYRRRPTQFVQGRPDPAYFGVDNINDIPGALLVNTPDFKFSSIGLEVPVDRSNRDENYNATDELPVYKIFANERLPEEELQKIFPSYTAAEVRDWAGAYPIYEDTESPVPPFELHDGIYYVNGIELAASAMEMSAIAGRNVALLAHARWTKNYGKIDCPDVSGNVAQDPHQGSDEL